MDLEGMVLKMHLMLELHQTNITLRLLPFINSGQMLPFEELGKISRTRKRMHAFFEQETLPPEANKAYKRSLFREHQ